MHWQLEINDRSQLVSDFAHLDALLRTKEAQSAVSLSLERVQQHHRPRWERLLYRVLGVPLAEHEAHGTLVLSLTPDRAMAVFMKDDDDVGVVATAGGANGHDLVEFVTSRGERFSEPARCCITREMAFAALREFYQTTKRPKSIEWMRVEESRQR
ncbi:MAG: hypothetical protein HZA90_24820 [Verrucomicrobia bacterium]|nr:hypothetical protein [Verrucomicrobiota bacterium]